jgi:signal peptidase I
MRTGPSRATVRTDVMAEIVVDSTPARHAAPKRSIAHRVMSAVMSIVVLVLAAGCMIAAVAVASGQWQASPVLSGSMEPTIPTGGVVITERVPVEDLAVGDIVMFQRPDEPGQVVHRIIELEPSEDGPLLQTQGDANATADPWQVQPEGATAQVARGSIPYVGSVTVAIRSADGQYALLIAAGVLIATGILLLGRRSKATPEEVSPEHDADDATA